MEALRKAQEAQGDGEQLSPLRPVPLSAGNRFNRSRPSLEFPDRNDAPQSEGGYGFDEKYDEVV